MKNGLRHWRQLERDYEMAHDPYVASLDGRRFRKPAMAACMQKMKGYVRERKKRRLAGFDYDGATNIPDAEIEKFVKMKKGRKKCRRKKC